MTDVVVSKELEGRVQLQRAALRGGNGRSLTPGINYCRPSCTSGFPRAPSELCDAHLRANQPVRAEVGRFLLLEPPSLNSRHCLTVG